MKHRIYLIASFFLLMHAACNRIKNKSQELADKVAPKFDAHKPDTKSNKKRFVEFLKVNLTSDIKNIYCFDDAMGVDADYMFSFNCNKTTANKIIDTLNLKLDKETTDYAFGIQHDFEWWDKKKIEKLDLYSWHDEHQYFKYFWYDSNEQKAYYFDYDL